MDRDWEPESPADVEAVIIQLIVPVV